MKRHWVFALAALIALPRLGQAQGDPGWGPVLRITPFVGVSPGIKQNGLATVFANNSVGFHDYRIEYPSSLPMGLNVEYRLWKQFGLVGGGVWASRGDTKLIDFEDEVTHRMSGSNFWMAKLGPVMRLREVNPDMQLKRLNASIFVAPAFIYDNPKVELTTPATATNGVNQWGLNIGADAELPLANPRLAFQLGLEDWMIFWDETNYASRIQAYLLETNTAIDAVSIEAKKTHFWILRAGLSFRF